jgi:hypothetical protein
MSVIEPQFSSSRLTHEDILDTFGELRRTGCRILDFEKFTRKSAEVVDRSRLSHRGDCDCRNVPVRRNAKNAFGFGMVLPILSKLE